MVFDRALTYAEISCDVLARMTRKDEIHDLMLPLRQRGHAGGCSPPQRRCIQEPIRLI